MSVLEGSGGGRGLKRGGAGVRISFGSGGERWGGLLG